MIAPGSKFVYSDLGALMTQANSLSSSVFSLSGFFDVSPMGYDGGGNAWGYRAMSNVTIGSRGRGYKPGDSVSLGYSSVFEIVSVNSSGGVLGVRIVNAGNGAYSDPATVSGGGGGSGSGLTMSANFNQLGPHNVAYSMPDYDALAGAITGFVVLAGGVGYLAGDTFTLAELPNWTFAVGGVDGGGAITGITFTAAALIDVPQTVGSMNVVGGSGSGATLQGVFTLNQRPDWLTELNRLRNNIAALPVSETNGGTFFNAINAPSLCVSGPWPVSAPTTNFLDTWFWFAGTAATVTVVSTFTGYSTGPFSTVAVMSTNTAEFSGDGWWGAEYLGSMQNGVFVSEGNGDPVDPGWTVGQVVNNGYTVINKMYQPGAYAIQDVFPSAMAYDLLPPNTSNQTFVGVFLTSVKLSFVIGGDAPLTLHGLLFVYLAVSPPGSTTVVKAGDGWGTETGTTTTQDSTNPLDLVSWDAGNMPGTITKLLSGQLGAGGNALGGGAEVVVVVSFNNQSVAPGKYTMTLNIQCPQDSHDQQTYAAMTQDPYGNPSNDISTYKVLTTTTVRTRVLPDPNGVPLMSGAAAYVMNPYAGGNHVFVPSGSLTASISFSAAVLASGIHNSLPVSKVQVPGDLAGDGPGICEVVQYPMQANSTWGPLQHHVSGDTILDANGNTQTANCPNGGSGYTGQVQPGATGYWSLEPGAGVPYQLVTQLPGWSTTIGGVTPDGTIQWTCTAINPVKAPAWQLAPYPQPVFGPERIIGGGFNITTSVPGFWTAMCQPISSLNIATAEHMPWNLGRTKYTGSGWTLQTKTVNPCLLGDKAPNVNNAPQISNSYDQTKTCEAQLEPPVWMASRYFTVGFTILDSNGNLQQATVSGTPPLPAGGVSGATAPAWATTVGATAPDGPGSLAWTCIKVFPGGIKSAQHRIPDIPRYPIYWQSETVARLMPPTTTSGLTIWGAYDQWMNVNANGQSGRGVNPDDPGWHKQENGDTGGMAYGWWIYSVSINRTSCYPAKTRGPASASEFGAGDAGAPGAGDLGASGTGAGGPGTGPNAGPITDASEISCTIGCIRNGAFVAFQTFQTGATYQVLWPVFTSDALVYQCSERLDIQAVAIATGNTVGIGQTIAEPALVAAFVTDTEALLNLIN